MFVLTLSINRVTGVTVTRRVEGIAVLYGMPKINTLAVLAHEFMHAWMALQDFSATSISQEVCEGTAELASYLYLNSTLLQKEVTEWESQLNVFLLKNLEDNKEGTYGVGFQKALQSYQHYHHFHRS